ncbi:MAG: plasmid pRiA4b ORF-3 family protein [Planctomycetota bacterium]
MGEYFRFHVQLVGVKPPIFRRFLLTTTASFHDLHSAIQVACGWENAHLFAFRPTDRDTAAIAGVPDDSGMGPPDPNAKKVPLTKWFSLTGFRTCVYEYDFGDGWMHDVKLETIEQHDGTWKRRLLDGARAFPPEDCGGLPGYENCIAALATGNDPDQMLEWLGKWMPEHFDQVRTRRRFDK